jgi:hypothetical protein
MPVERVRNAHGMTPKMELFCQLLARGRTLSDSYREAYRTVGNAKTVNEAASRLWAKPEIRARVELLCEQQSAMLLRDSVAIRRHVFSGLLAESRDRENKGSERIAALIALGKIDSVGMFRELHGIERTAERTPEAIQMELEAKLKPYLTLTGVAPGKSNGASASDS